MTLVAPASSLSARARVRSRERLPTCLPDERSKSNPISICRSSGRESERNFFATGRRSSRVPQHVPQAVVTGVRIQHCAECKTTPISRTVCKFQQKAASRGGQRGAPQFSVSFSVLPTNPTTLSLSDSEVDSHSFDSCKVKRRDICLFNFRGFCTENRAAPACCTGVPSPFAIQA
eukprot:COSAG02_NODE_3522_length_6617_cov_2.604173_3_plen_175_part_00